MFCFLLAEKSLLQGQVRWGFPRWLSGKNMPANTGDTGDPRPKKWQPAPAFLAGKFQRERRLVGWSLGWQRAGHHWAYWTQARRTCGSCSKPWAPVMIKSFRSVCLTKYATHILRTPWVWRNTFISEHIHWFGFELCKNLILWKV